MDGWMDGSSIVGSLVQTTVINVIGMLNATAQVRRGGGGGAGAYVGTRS